MAREFVMGARITLKDMFTSPLKNVTKATDKFKESVNATTKAAGNFTDANGRLRSSTGQFLKMNGDMNKGLSGTATAISTASGHVSNLSGQFMALAGAIGGAAAAKKAFDSTIAAAAEFEQSEIVIDAMFDDKKLSKQYTEMLESFAIDSPIMSSQDMFGNSKSFIAMSKDMKELEAMWGLTERMAAVDPAQGVKGAVFALRELFSGDAVSMVERFEMPRSVMNDIKKLPIKDQLVELDKLFNKMGITTKLVDNMGESTLGLWQRVKESTAKAFREMGTPALDSLRPFLKGIVTAMEDGSQNGAIAFGQKFITGLVNVSIKGFKMMKVAANELQPVFSFVGGLFNTLGDTANAFYKMIFGNGDQTYFANALGVTAASALNNIIWDVIDTGKMLWSFASGTLFPILKEGFLIAKDAAKELSIFILESYFTVQKYLPYIQGLAIAFAGYYAVVKTVAAATKVWGMVQAAFNAVMAMNPIMLVIIAIGLLIGYLVHLAGGWDVVKQKLVVLWQYMITAWTSIKAWLVPFVASMIQNVIQWFRNIWLAVQPLLTTIWTGIVNVFNAVKSFWDQWGGLISAVFSVYWEVYKSIFMSALSIIWTIVKGAFEYISTIISGIFKVISGIIQVGWAVISGLFTVALDLLSGNWEGAWNGMLDMLSGVWSGVQDFFSGLKDLFFDSGMAIMKTLAEGITKAASAPFEAVGAALKKVRELLPFSDAKTGPLSSLTHNGGKIVSTMAEGVYSQAGTLHKAMSDTLADTPTSTTVGANQHRINAAGSGKGTGTGDRRTQIKNLIEKLVIQGTDKDGKTIADEVIEAIYEKLTQAEDILSAGDWGELLND